MKISFSIAASIVSMFIISTVITGFLAVTVLTQQKVDNENIGESIVIKSAAAMLAENLSSGEIEKFTKLEKTINKSVKLISKKFESSMYGMYTKEIIESETKLYAASSKLNISLKEIKKDINLISDRKLILEGINEQAEKLIKLSDGISRLVVSSNLSKSKVYYVATQAERIRKIKESIKNTNIESGKIKKELKDFNNVIRQLAYGDDKTFKGQSTKSNSRKLIHVTMKRFKIFKENIMKVISNTNAFEKINSDLSESSFLAQKLSDIASELAGQLSAVNSERALNPTSILFGVFISLVLLLLSGVSWFVYTKDNALLDNERLKSQKKAFKHLMKEIREFGDGDLHTKFKSSSPFTKDIASQLNNTKQQLNEIIGSINMQSRVIGVATETVQSIEAESSKNKHLIETVQQEFDASIESFHEEQNQFNDKFDLLPKVLQEQQSKISDMSKGVSKNYELAVKLIQDSRSISTMFKNQSEISQALQGVVSKLNEKLSSIESDLFNMQILIGDDKSIGIESMIDNVQSARGETQSCVTNIELLVSAAGDNQVVVEEMRDSILSLNEVAQTASEQGKAVNSDSQNIMVELNTFKESADTVFQAIGSITELSDKAQQNYSMQDTSRSEMLSLIKEIKSSLDHVSEITKIFRVDAKS